VKYAKIHMKMLKKIFSTIDIVFKKGLIIMFLRVFHSFPQNARVEK